MKSPRSAQRPDHPRPAKARRLAMALAVVVALVAGLAVTSSPAAADTAPGASDGTSAATPPDATTPPAATPPDATPPAADPTGTADPSVASDAAALTPFVSGSSDPITDYANYPDNITPAIYQPSCAARGSATVVGEVFTVGTVSSSDLRSFTLSPGDVLTMTWTGWAPGCEDTGISLSAKRADQAVFDPATNQELVPPYAYCGPGGSTCTNGQGFGPLTLVIPARSAACNFQIDAVNGPPLAIVGPKGSFYNAASRGGGGSDMLIAANNGGAGSDCAPPEPHTTVTPSCGRGAILINISNTGEIDATFTVTADGSVIFDADIAGGTSQDLVVPATEDTIHHITVVAQGLTLFDEDVPFNCVPPAPDAQAALDCAQGGVVVTVHNSDLNAITVDILKGAAVVFNDVAVGSGQTVSRVVALAEDATATISVTSGGQTVLSQAFTRDCVHPAVVVTNSCAQGGIRFVLTNPTGGSDAHFTVIVGDVITHKTVPPDTTTTFVVAVAENTTVQVTVSEDSEAATLFDQPITHDCIKPSATITPSCAQGGVVVTLTNGADAESPAEFTVTAGDVVEHRTVQPDDSVDVFIPVAEGATVEVIVTEASQAEPLADQTITPDCVGPTATVVHDCAQGGVVVTLTNSETAQSDAQFTVTANGVTVAEATVAPGDSTTVTIPLAEGDTVTVVVTEASETNPLASETITQDCQKPVVTVQNVCDTGARLVFSNTGESPVELTVKQDGTVIDTVTVPANGSTEKTYPMAEDATSVFRVTGPDFDSGNMTVVHNCIEDTTTVQDNTSAPGNALPRTGASTGPLVGFGLLLILLGGLLLGISTRPVPAFVRAFAGRAVPPGAYRQPMHLAPRGWTPKRQ